MTSQSDQVGTHDEDLPSPSRHLAVSGCLVTDALLPPPPNISSNAVARVQLVRRRLCSLLVMLIFVGLLALCPQAFADSASISVTNTAGQSDPAAEMPRVFTVSGATSAPERIFIKYRNPGGAPCASTAATDTGQWFENYYEEYGEAFETNGVFSFSHAGTWRSTGTFVFCIWIAPNDDTIVPTPITQTLTFRSPTGTITATVNPLMPRPNQQATITIMGTSEAPENVYAKIRASGGAACATSYEADSGQSLIEGKGVNGSFTVEATTTQSKAGTYVICLWLASSANSTLPIAGPQPENFTVGYPPPPPPPLPPCIVPSFSSRMHLATVEQRIRAAHCAVGKIHHVSSYRYRRGFVIRLSAKPDSTLPWQAKIEVFVSNGRPRHHRR